MLQSSRPGRFIFGHPLAGKPGFGSRAIGGAIGGILGSHIPVPGAAEVGMGAGMMLPEAVQKVNNRIAGRMGDIASSSRATADAIENSAKRNKPKALDKYRR